MRNLRFLLLGIIIGVMATLSVLLWASRTEWER